MVPAPTPSPIRAVKHDGHVANRTKITDLDRIRFHNAIFEQISLDGRPEIERSAIADLHKIEFRQQRRLKEHPFSNLAAQQPEKPCGVGRAQHRWSLLAMRNSINGGLAVI